MFFLPCYICDQSRHSKNKNFVQLDGDSFCFLPLYAKFLSKRLNHNKLLQHEVTIFSEGQENLCCRFMHTTRTIFVTSNLGSCVARFVLGIQCHVFMHYPLLRWHILVFHCICRFWWHKGFKLCIASSATCKYKLYVSYSHAKRWRYNQGRTLILRH